jgi:hypothetical protein
MRLLYISFCLQVLLLNPNTKAQCTGTCIYSQWFLTTANCNPEYDYIYFLYILYNTVFTHVVFTLFVQKVQGIDV